MPAASRAIPPSLTDLADAPPLLWAIGDTGSAARPMIALVGARNASSLGTRMARVAGARAGRGGLCRRLGAGARRRCRRPYRRAGHRARSPCMAGGVDVIYPAENADWPMTSPARGLRLSEQPMGLQPQARHFPRRNRIISGLAQAVVVVEAAAKSGSLITARDALDQGREVLAVPGHPFDARAAGCNMLIRDGALLVRNAEDVLDSADRLARCNHAETARAAAEFPPPPPETRSLRRKRRALHQQILSRLGPSPVAEDQLIRDLDAPARDRQPGAGRSGTGRQDPASGRRPAVTSCLSRAKRGTRQRCFRCQ